MHLIALLDGGLEELDTHTEFRMGHQNDATGVDFEIAGFDREDDAGAAREWRSGGQIARTQTEVSETAGDGRIVGLGLGTLAVQPLAQGVALLVGGILEADAGLIASTSPGQLSINFEFLIHAGQFEREMERVFFGYASGKLDGHATFGKIDGFGFVMSGSLTLDWYLHGDAQLETALPLHQGADGAKTGFGALDRERFVENEMGPHFEAAFQTDGGFDQHDRERPFIDRGGLRGLHYGSIFRPGAVYDDGIETLAGETADSLVRGGAVLDANFEITEHAAQDAHGLFVGTQQ